MDYNWLFGEDCNEYEVLGVKHNQNQQEKKNGSNNQPTYC